MIWVLPYHSTGVSAPSPFIILAPINPCLALSSCLLISVSPSPLVLINTNILDAVTARLSLGIPVGLYFQSLVLSSAGVLLIYPSLPVSHSTLLGITLISNRRSTAPLFLG